MAGLLSSKVQWVWEECISTGSSPTSCIKLGRGPPQQDSSSLEDIILLSQTELLNQGNQLSTALIVFLLLVTGKWYTNKVSSHSHLSCAYPQHPAYKIVKRGPHLTESLSYRDDYYFILPGLNITC